MSVSLMAIAFRAKVSSTQKLVLLALCDAANDQGECYPSVSKLTDKCSLSERAVQAAIAGLESAGHLRRELRTGRATVYWMTPHEQPPQVAHPRSTRTPASSAPPQHMHPAADAPPQDVPPAAGAPTPAPAAPPPPHVVHPTPAAGAPITITEPPVEPSKKRQRPSPPPSVSAGLLVEAGFERVMAEEFIEHKTRLKAPLTERAWADHQREAAKAGWSVVEAAEKVMAKGWKGFEAAYVVGKSTGRPAAMPQAALTVPSGAPAATDDYLARQAEHAARATAAPANLRDLRQSILARKAGVA